MNGTPPRFPVTVWPNQPLDPVVIERACLILAEARTAPDELLEDVLAKRVSAEEIASKIVTTKLLDWGEPMDAQPLPDGWVWRQLADADLGDDQQVAGLLEYGAIRRDYMSADQATFDFTMAVIPPEVWESHLVGDTPRVTIEDARWWLRTLRAIYRTWEAAKQRRSVAPAWAAEGFRPQSEDEAWARFEFALNHGLRAFQAHVRPGGDKPNETLPPMEVDLYTGACVQIFNTVATTDGTLKKCPECKRLFPHAIGGAKHGQYRSDALYCSLACGAVKRQRDWRQSQKKEKKS